MTHRLLHVITPGDHFSPSTGSAIPTVVHGLSYATPPGEPRPAVLVGRGTYGDRYDSADALEYDLARGRRFDRQLDAALARIGLPRVTARRSYAAALADQHTWEPSIVLAHNAPQAVPLVDAGRHVPVLYAHNVLLRTYRRREAMRALGPAAVIVCVSEYLAARTTTLLPRELHERVRVVLNGVDVNAFARPGHARRDGALRVAFVGRMIPDKGADVLLEAVLRLDRPDIHLTLVGASGFGSDDPLTTFEQDIRHRAQRLGQRVTVRPFVPRAEVAALLTRADVVVVPSRWPDPCPLTVLEGMAAGAAVVGSEIGGIPEMLRGVGILVPPGDPQALAEVLEGLATDGALLERTAAACLAAARARDWRRVRDELGSVLQEALSGRG